MTATEIDNILMLKHKERGDFFITQICTQTENKGYLDGWAMKPSYMSPQTWGYEVKVNRHDFIQDEKYHEYLKVCHSFYFVCPYGLIKPDEVPQESGLIWISPKGLCLTKKKSQYRNIDLPTRFLMGIILNKMNEVDREYKLARAKRMFETRKGLIEDSRNIGHWLLQEIEDKLKRQHKEKLEKYQTFERKLVDQLKSAGLIKNRFDDYSDWSIEYAVNDLVKNASIKSQAESIKNEMSIMIDKIDRILKLKEGETNAEDDEDFN